MAGEVDHREQEVAELPRARPGRASATARAQLADLLLDLGQDRRRPPPVEPDPRRAFLQLERAGQGRKAPAARRQDARVVAARGLRARRRLAVLPDTVARRAAGRASSSPNTCGCRAIILSAIACATPSKSNAPSSAPSARGRPPAAADRPARLAGRPVLALDRVGDLVGLLDRVGRDGGEGLLDVPGAAALGIAQPAHHREQPVDPALGAHSRVPWRLSRDRAGAAAVGPAHGQRRRRRRRSSRSLSLAQTSARRGITWPPCTAPDDRIAALEHAGDGRAPQSWPGLCGERALAAPVERRRRSPGASAVSSRSMPRPEQRKPSASRAPAARRAAWPESAPAAAHADRRTSSARRREPQVQPLPLLPHELGRRCAAAAARPGRPGAGSPARAAAAASGRPRADRSSRWSSWCSRRLDPWSSRPAEPAELQDQVAPHRHRHLGGRGRRRRAAVGDEIDQRRVGLVARPRRSAGSCSRRPRAPRPPR